MSHTKNGIPLISLGTWKSPEDQTEAAVRIAIINGYRGIDCANDYANESAVGRAIAGSIADGVCARQDLFIQAKCWNTNHRAADVRADLEATLLDLQVNYVDCYLIHWPQACPSAGTLSLAKNGSFAAHKSKGTMFPLEEDGTYSVDAESHFVETWKAMEQLVDQGKCRRIGLSNFNRRQVREILNIARIKPAVLQNESHPYLAELDLRRFCDLHGIVFQAYSPLGSGDRPWLKDGPPWSGVELLQDPALLKIAETHKKSVAQVVLRWHLQMGGAAVPKSVTPSRIAENIRIFDFELSGEDMGCIAARNIGWRHLLWEATAGHPDYPFKDELPHDFKVPKAPTATK